jgi:hypothetical protein
VPAGGLTVRQLIDKQLAHLTTSRVNQQDLPIAAIAEAVRDGFRAFLDHDDICADLDFWRLREWAYATWSATKPPVRSGS